MKKRNFNELKQSEKELIKMVVCHNVADIQNDKEQLLNSYIALISKVYAYLSTYSDINMNVINKPIIEGKETFGWEDLEVAQKEYLRDFVNEHLDQIPGLDLTEKQLEDINSGFCSDKTLYEIFGKDTFTKEFFDGEI